MTKAERGAWVAEKFRDPDVTAGGEPRAVVPLERLDTLWFNTGTLCNITCANCYIESSPVNDRLAFVTAAEVRGFLEEIERERLGTRRIGFTGGEPFVNPDILAMFEQCLSRGFEVLVLTNAMQPMVRWGDRLAALAGGYRDALVVRVSIDHYRRALHEKERGERTWEPMLRGVRWLMDNGFRISVAGRTCWGEDERSLREGYGRLFAQLGVDVDAWDPEGLVLFPEMDELADVPEITAGCWAKLGKSPSEVMCSNSRMVVKRKGADGPVVACTLIAYDERFEMGATLAEARRAVVLNHTHCSRFCVLGGGACVR